MDFSTSGELDVGLKFVRDLFRKTKVGELFPADSPKIITVKSTDKIGEVFKVIFPPSHSRESPVF